MMRVLIVDDEAPIRRFLRTWVEAEGASPIEAETAEEALSLCIAEGAPAVALCDVRLPGRDGLWLADQLRTACPDTAVVLTTAVSDFDVAVQGLQARVVDYLVKPYTGERFVDAFRKALLVYQARRAHAQMQKELDDRRAQITEALAQLELNQQSALDAMEAMLQARDTASFHHAGRVAKLAVDLAMTLEIGEPQLSDIERAARLHNLGRLAMPDDLLKRPAAKLSASERAQLRSYPLHGYAMLKNVPFLAGANQIAVATHERYDGSGFPHGLRGDKIPLGARIIAVADAYDELVSGIRGPVVTPARAVEVLARERAAQFDPLVLEALRTLQPTSDRVS